MNPPPANRVFKSSSYLSGRSFGVRPDSWDSSIVNGVPLYVSYVIGRRYAIADIWGRFRTFLGCFRTLSGNVRKCSKWVQWVRMGMRRRTRIIKNNKEKKKKDIVEERFTESRR